MNRLNTFEDDFEKMLQSIDVAKRQKAGILLPVIPNHEKWEDFIASVKTEWRVWRRDLTKYPKCLVVLYGGWHFMSTMKIHFGVNSIKQ